MSKLLALFGLVLLSVVFLVPGGSSMTMGCAGDTPYIICEQANPVLGSLGDQCHAAGIIVRNLPTPANLTPQGDVLESVCDTFKQEADEQSEEGREAATENASAAKELLEDTIFAPAPEPASPPPAAGPESQEPDPQPVPPPSPATPAIDPAEERFEGAPAPPAAEPFPNPEPPVTDAPSPPPSDPISASAASDPFVVPGGLPASGEAVAAAVVTVAGVPYLLSLLYNRLSKKRVESHALRRKLLGLVQSRPGTTPAELARSLAIHPSTVIHHLRILARFGLVVIQAERGDWWCFENHGRVPEHDRRPLAFLQRPTNRALLQTIREHESLRLSDAASRLGIPVSTAAYRAAQLVRVGLLHRQQRGWRLTERALILFSRESQTTSQVGPEWRTPTTMMPTSVASGAGDR